MTTAVAGDVKMMDACPASPANDLHHHHLHHHQQQQLHAAVENRKRPLQDTLDGTNVKRTHSSSVAGKAHVPWSKFSVRIIVKDILNINVRVVV